MNISHTLASRQANYASYLAQLESAIEAGADSQAIDSRIDNLTIMRSDLDALGRAEQVLTGQLVEVGRSYSSAPSIVHRTREKGLPFGTHLARTAVARVRAHLENMPLDTMVEHLFPGEQATLAVARSMTGSADTLTVGWAAELVRSEVRGMLQTDLAPISIAAALAVRGVSLPFNGAQEVTIPSVSARGVAMAGAWVGQSGAIPVVKGVVNAVKAQRYKLAAITCLTNELRRVSDPDAVELLRRMLLQDAANLLDTNLLDSSPVVANVRPAGLLNGVMVGAGAVGGGMAAVLADLKTLVGQLITNKVGAKPVLIIDSITMLGLELQTNAMGEFVWRVELANGRLLIVDVIASPLVPLNTAICVDAAYFASAFDPPEVDYSEQATLTMANADAVAPTQAGAAPLGGALGTAGQVVPDGGIPVAGGSGASIAGVVAQSLWQTWQFGIRQVWPVSWGMTRPGAVAALNNLTW